MQDPNKSKNKSADATPTPATAEGGSAPAEKDDARMSKLNQRKAGKLAMAAAAAGSALNAGAQAVKDLARKNLFTDKPAPTK